jgi:hypothetical protein
MNFAQIPDPDTLPPAARDALLATPWFRQVINLHQSGVDVTSELMEKLATRPGAQGFMVTEFEIEPGKKSRGLLDVATGELVSPDKLKGPAFEPTVKAVKDPTTGQTSSVLMTSPSSAVPFSKAKEQAPLMQKGYEASPVFDDKRQVIAHVYAGPDGEIRTVSKGTDMSAFLGLMGGQPAAPQGAPAAPAPAAPAPAAPQAVDTSYIVKTAEDYARVPKGATYTDPTGKRRTKQ